MLNSMDFNRIFDILKYAIDNKNVNEIIVIEDKTEIKIKNHIKSLTNN